MYHTGYSISEIGITSAIQSKAIISALHSKYIHTNNSDTTPEEAMHDDRAEAFTGIKSLINREITYFS